MLNDLLNAVLQLLAFTLLPFLVYLITKRKAGGFLDWVGLKKSTRKAILLALAVSLIFLIPPIVFSFISPEFKETLMEPSTMTGKFRAMGPGISTLVVLVAAAVIKTSLSEEILFRGFVAKRLIAWLGFQVGNISQAFIFGIIHFAIFINLSEGLFFPIAILIISGLGAYISAYLNEKLANGSIIPGWISHAMANLVSYSYVALVL